MTLLEGLLRYSVVIDFNEDPWYGSDQMYIAYPIRFATVQFQLLDTNSLISIVDQLRIENGFCPMHPTKGFTDEDCDQNCWYNFYVSINGLPEYQCDNAISCHVINSDQADNEQEYQIALSDAERKALFQCLDDQCIEHIGKTCVELLREADEEIK